MFQLTVCFITHCSCTIGVRQSNDVNARWNYYLKIRLHKNYDKLLIILSSLINIENMTLIKRTQWWLNNWTLVISYYFIVYRYTYIFEKNYFVFGYIHYSRSVTILFNNNNNFFLLCAIFKKKKKIYKIFITNSILIPIDFSILSNFNVTFSCMLVCKSKLC